MPRPDADLFVPPRIPSSPPGHDGRVTAARLVAVLLALGWLVWQVYASGKEALFEALLLVSLPLAAIWWPERLGRLRRWRTSVVSVGVLRPSPALHVQIAGWFALLVITVGAPLIGWLVRTGVW